MKPGRLEIVQCSLGNAASLEYVVRNADRIQARHRGPAGWKSRVWVRDHIDRALQAGNREIVQEGLREMRGAELIVSVIRQALQKIAFDASNDAPCRML